MINLQQQNENINLRIIFKVTKYDNNHNKK